METTDKQVAKAWIKGKAARSVNMHTDGQTVWAMGDPRCQDSWHHVIGTTQWTPRGSYGRFNKIAIVCRYGRFDDLGDGKPNALLAVANYVEVD